MKKFAMLLTMLPLAALADMPRSVRLDDLGVSFLLFFYWTVIAFATGTSIVLWKFRSSMNAAVMLIFGALSVMIIYLFVK